jgi:pullulanase
MNATALAMVILSFGIPFIQAGTEFLRSKYGDHNSYKSSAYLNRMHWSYKKDHRHVFDFVKALIEFRKSQQVFKLDNKDDIIAAVHMLEDIRGIIRYELLSPFKDDYSKILIAYNGTDKEVAFDVSDYKVHIDGALYYNDKCEIKENILYLPRYASVVLIKD